MDEAMEKWVLVGDKWTKVTVLGYSNGESLCVENSTRTVVLVIPGNPGNGKFYERFSHCFLQQLRTFGALKYGLNETEIDDISLYIVSQLNHVILPNDLGTNVNHEQSIRFDLLGQIQHKIDFCRQYLAKSAKLILIGHSIGAYIMLKLIKELTLSGYTVIRSFGLFPTIERMRASPKGQRLYSLLSFLNSYDSWMKPIMSCINWLPDSFKLFCCKLYFTYSKTPQCVIEATQEIIDVNILRNIVHMALSELDTVDKLDKSLVERTDIVRLFYGTHDGWCPIEYGKAMLERLGENVVKIDSDNCDHAFVIKSGEVVAKRLIEWL